MVVVDIQLSGGAKIVLVIDPRRDFAAAKPRIGHVYVGFS